MTEVRGQEGLSGLVFQISAEMRRPFSSLWAVMPSVGKIVIAS